MLADACAEEAFARAIEPDARALFDERAEFVEMLRLFVSDCEHLSSNLRTPSGREIAAAVTELQERANGLRPVLPFAAAARLRWIQCGTAKALRSIARRALPCAQPC